MECDSPSASIGFLQGPGDKFWTCRTFEILQLLTKFCHRRSFIIINILTILRKFDKNFYSYIDFQFSNTEGFS